MKIPLLFAILLALTGSCHKDTDIGPTDLLYQRWQWESSRLADQRVFLPDSTRPTVITFRASGEYTVEFSGRQFTCCQPNYFVRKGRKLLFSNVAGGYVSPECTLLNCAPYQPEQTIYSLSEQQLVLSDDKGQIVYKRAP